MENSVRFDFDFVVVEQLFALSATPVAQKSSLAFPAPVESSQKQDASATPWRLDASADFDSNTFLRNRSSDPTQLFLAPGDQARSSDPSRA